MFTRLTLFAGIAVAGLSACSQPEPVIGPEPISDKYGNFYCPEGYVLQGLECIIPPAGYQPPGGNGTVPGQPGTVPTDPVPGGNQNQNTNQNQNQNTNENQNQQG